MRPEDVYGSKNGIQERIKYLATILFSPPRENKDIYLRRRSQLVSAASFMLSVPLLVGFFLGSDWLKAHVIFLSISIPCYFISRTKYHAFAAALFSFGGLVYVYLSINLGSTPDLESAVVPWAILWLIFSGAILSPTGFALFGITATFLTFGAPFYTAQTVSDGKTFHLGGIVLSIFAMILILRLYRDFALAARLRNLMDENRELERTRLDLELHLGVQAIDLNERAQDVEFRLNELDAAKRRLDAVTLQLEVLGQIIDLPYSNLGINGYLDEIARIVGLNFNFHHVGIYLLDESREYVILVSAHGEGGQELLSQNHRVQEGQAGAIGKTIATHKLFLINENPDLLPGSLSELTLPIMGIADDQLLGVIDIQSHKDDAFYDEDQRFLQLISTQVGRAIENIRVSKSTDNTAAGDESDALQVSHTEVWSQFTPDQRSIGYRYDVNGPSPLTTHFSHSGTDSGAVGRTSDYLSVPITLRGEFLGELLVHASSGKRWNEDELDMIQAVAERVALSAENARLFEETNRRAERERMVSEITSKIRSTNDPNEMIIKAVQELKSALGVSRVEVRPQKTSNNADIYEA